MFIQKIKKIINDNTIEVKINSNAIKPYINQRILNLIKIRNKYSRLKLKFRDNNLITEKFKYYKTLCRNEIRKSKKDYFEKQFKKSISSPRLMWQNLNTVLYNKSKTSTSPCSQLIENGISITQKQSIADHFNRFFVRAANDVTSKIRINQTEFDELHDRERYNIVSSFTCASVTQDEIKLIINNLKSSNATDIHGMSNSFIKFHRNSLACNLAKLINDCMYKGIFPDILKLGVVTPVFKTGDKTRCNNYRPITINPILGKIFEYAIYRRLQSHLDNNNIINKNQYGYVKKSNCEIAASHILNDVYELIDERKSVALTCIDLSKAFDCIQFDILISKLKKLGLKSFFLNLLISYLYGRKQAVKIDEFLSIFLLIDTGSPQGGVLSGLFFDLYINSIFDLHLLGKLSLYCDDMSLISSGDETQELKANIETDLDLIKIWLNNHFLSPNVTKTKYVLFQGRRVFENFTETAMNIQFNGNVIERVESVKILGLVVDETLSFRNHIDEIKKKIIPFIYALRRARKFISVNTAKSLYYAYIQSHFVYMSTIWSGISVGLMKSLEVIQRKALRIVLKKSWFAGKQALYSVELLPVSALCRATCCLQVFKIASNLIKNNVEIRFVSDIHNYSTRNRGNFVIRHCRTSLATQNFYIRAFSNFNNLPQHIKNFNSINIIKNRLREHFLEEFCNAN
jgi:hypothetical protein